MLDAEFAASNFKNVKKISPQSTSTILALLRDTGFSSQQLPTPVLLSSPETSTVAELPSLFGNPPFRQSSLSHKKKDVWVGLCANRKVSLYTDYCWGFVLLKSNSSVVSPNCEGCKVFLNKSSYEQDLGGVKVSKFTNISLLSSDQKTARIVDLNRVNNNLRASIVKLKKKVSEALSASEITNTFAAEDSTNITAVLTSVTEIEASKMNDLLSQILKQSFAARLNKKRPKLSSELIDEQTSAFDCTKETMALKDMMTEHLQHHIQQIQAEVAHKLTGKEVGHTLLLLFLLLL